MGSCGRRNLKLGKVEPQIWQSDHAPKKWLILGAKKVKTTAKKIVVPRIHMDMDILQKTGRNWSILASTAPFTIYTPIYGVATVCYISQPR